MVLISGWYFQDGAGFASVMVIKVDSGSSWWMGGVCKLGVVFASR